MNDEPPIQANYDEEPGKMGGLFCPPITDAKNIDSSICYAYKALHTS
jgi:hypothetical protein